MATYDMEVNLAKDRKRATTNMTVIHATMKQMIRVKGHGRKLYMDNYFSSPDLYNEITAEKINCWSTDRQDCKGMMDDRSKTPKLKQGDITIRKNCNMTAVVWKNKHDVQVLTNIHDPPAESNFCDESGNALKPASVEDYNQHMNYVNKSEGMASSYSISRRTWKWKK